MKKFVIPALMVSILGFTSCTKGNDGCIDTSIIKKGDAIPEILHPVCGCDGITYENEYIAKYWHGVMRWKEGECMAE
jgi:hypothetical protein